VVGLRGVIGMGAAGESVTGLGVGVPVEAAAVAGHVAAVVVDLRSYEIDGMAAVHCALALEDVHLDLDHVRLQLEAHAEDYTFDSDRESSLRHGENVSVE
jgi:hypothetical protein